MHRLSNSRVGIGLIQPPGTVIEILEVVMKLSSNRSIARTVSGTLTSAMLSIAVICLSQETVIVMISDSRQWPSPLPRGSDCFPIYTHVSDTIASVFPC